MYRSKCIRLSIQKPRHDIPEKEAEIFIFLSAKGSSKKAFRAWSKYEDDGVHSASRKLFFPFWQQPRAASAARQPSSVAANHFIPMRLVRAAWHLLYLGLQPWFAQKNFHDVVLRDFGPNFFWQSPLHSLTTRR